MTTQEFPHQHTAHCESGVMSTLLKYHGHNLDEAMIFGIAHALTFVWMPLIKLNGMPLVSYRTAPRSIIKNTCKALGLKLSIRKFSDAQSGQAALDAALSSGKLAGLQTSVFWLPYFPPQMRFHFNAHNLLVYGKDGNDYLISDPVFETVQRCAAEDLQRARFAKGVLAAKGMMYTLEDNRPSEQIMADLPAIIRKAIRKNAKHMLAPVFFIGVKGIRTLAKKIESLPAKQNEKYQKTVSRPFGADAGRNRHRRRRFPLHLRLLPRAGHPYLQRTCVSEGLRTNDRHRRPMAPIRSHVRETMQKTVRKRLPQHCRVFAQDCG